MRRVGDKDDKTRSVRLEVDVIVFCLRVAVVPLPESPQDVHEEVGPLLHNGLLL